MTTAQTPNTSPPTSAVSGNEGNLPVQSPDFPPLQPGQPSSPLADLGRFQDVQVTISAELGRTKVPIQKLLQVGVGSVIELNRPISSPVWLMAQGVPLASGEVVVVNDCFAIRIKEIFAGDAQSLAGGE